MRFSRYPRLLLGSLVLCLCVVTLPCRAAESDQQIMAAFKVEAARISQEINAAGEDLAKVAALQKQMQALITDVMGKVSPKSRIALEVSMKVINPLMTGGIAYTGTVQKYVEAGGFDYTSATSAEIIDRRLEQLTEIERLNDDLIKRAASLDTDIEAVLKASKLSDAEKTSFLAGFQSSSGKRLGAMRAVRGLDARLYVEVRGIYKQLREQLGKWSVKDGELSFDDDAQIPIYNARIERINVIAERQEVAQRQALGIK